MALVRRRKNKDCFVCGRRHPTGATIDDYGDFAEYRCPRCSSMLLREISAGPQRTADLPGPVIAPEQLQEPPLRIDEPRWHHYAAYYLDNLLLARINGRCVYGTPEAEAYVDNVLRHV